MQRSWNFKLVMTSNFVFFSSNSKLLNKIGRQYGKKQLKG